MARIEVLNWSTFHRTIWAFGVDGRSALLTGGVGSGKSTLVDAMTTLLLSANKIAYNKAAGAEAKERDLRSHVLGHHRTERVESSTRPVPLRTSASHSVIPAVSGPLSSTSQPPPRASPSSPSAFCSKAQPRPT
ncbi:ATP-binding protein [Kitasatospora sp. NPDC059327]|uniref:ATP-binding protein n=1 Tax=Kitasatospora sp. NPDC059327 TaxID=3346803 RepID=UPI0036CE0C6C